MIEVPANYFGKGKDYILPDDPAIITEFERRWREWEEAHPNDPMGEFALAKYETSAPSTKRTTEEKEPIELLEARSEIEWSKLKLEVPDHYIELFKNYCKYKRRRPRDIFMAWVDAHCKL